jgi:hypothetical protein
MLLSDIAGAKDTFAGRSLAMTGIEAATTVEDAGTSGTERSVLAQGGLFGVDCVRRVSRGLSMSLALGRHGASLAASTSPKEISLLRRSTDAV